MWRWAQYGVVAASAGAALLFGSDQLHYLTADATSKMTIQISRSQRNDVNNIAFINEGSRRGPKNDADAAIDPRGSSPASAAENLRLRNVQVFFRHGARSPLKVLTFLDQPLWPKHSVLADPDHPVISHRLMDLRGEPVGDSPFDAVYNKTVFNGGTPAGQLTSVGKAQMIDLGERLRTDYVEKRKFLTPSHRATEVFVRSTNIKRTIESAQWLLSGLYRRNEGGDDVTVYVEPGEREILYPNFLTCQRLKSSNQALPETLETFAELTKHRAELQQVLNYEHTHSESLNYVDLRDEVAARQVESLKPNAAIALELLELLIQAHDLPVPENVLSVMDDIERFAVSTMVFVLAGSFSHLEEPRQELVRLACGPVLHLISSNMDAAMSSNGSFKLHLFACHDSLLMPLLMALGAFDGRWPPFAADLTFEIYEDPTGQPFVRVLYCGNPLKLPLRNSEFISLEDFKTAIGPYVTSFKEYMAECRISV